MCGQPIEYMEHMGIRNRTFRLPWAQGVGRSNRPAPTNCKQLICLRRWRTPRLTRVLSDQAVSFATRRSSTILQVTNRQERTRHNDIHKSSRRAQIGVLRTDSRKTERGAPFAICCLVGSGRRPHHACRVDKAARSGARGRTPRRGARRDSAWRGAIHVGTSGRGEGCIPAELRQLPRRASR
jgi:hypothetical protein